MACRKTTVSLDRVSGDVARVVALVATVSIAGCADARGPDGLRWSGTVAVQDGLTLVTNPATPALAEGRVRIDSLWIAPTGDPPEWAAPTRIAGGQGRYFVLD